MIDLSNENMIHIKNGDCEYLQFRRFLEYSDKIEHCYTIRPLDFKITKEVNADESYNKICDSLNINFKNLYRPSQTHSNNVKCVNDEPAGIYKREFADTDGLITDRKNKILSLCYADCIPLFFYDPNKKVIANVHSGWRGTYQEISKIAVCKLKEQYDVSPESLICRNRT